MKIITKDFCYRGRHYYIVFDGKYYSTIEYKYVSATGQLLRKLVYTDGLHTSTSLTGCIEDTKRDLDIEHLVNKGYSKKEAFSKVMGIDMALLDGIDF